MKQKSKVYTFSAKDDDQVWLEGFKERLGDGSFSKAVVDGLKKLGECGERSKVEHDFDEYCRKNFLSKDAQLKLLMTDLRVCNGI